jgi:hypothetical protein
MKNKILLSVITVFALIFGSTEAFSQYPKKSIRDIQFVSQSDLSNCNDSSAYVGDTVTIVGKVLVNGNLAEVPSSSVQGGFRPFVWLIDTADGGSGGSFKGIDVMGVYSDGGSSLPVTDVFNLIAGSVVELTGIIGRYQGETQLAVLNNSSLKTLSLETAPSPVVIDLGKLNDDNRANNLETGEEYEGSFIELRDLTVTAVTLFSGNRVSFDVADKNGNLINVSDRFFVQKTKSYSSSRASAPSATGSFEAPVIGTKYEYLRGIILHSQNGCTGSGGRGYELNPFDTSHYRIGVTPPNITNVSRTPLIPKAVDKVKMSAKIVDFDGTITATSLYYTDNINANAAAFTKVTMTVKSGTTDEYEAEIPAFANGTVVRYYITASDNDNQTSYLPFGASSSENADFRFYTVRDNGLGIVDLQRVLNYRSDASPYSGQTVTVTGVVTASAKAYDLESIFIQDPNETKWAGINCTGNSELLKLFRTEEVEVTGTVSESNGYTILTVTNVTVTGNRIKVAPITINASDSAFYASREAETYEGMLVQFVNSGGDKKIHVSNARQNAFGDYRRANTAMANNANSCMVQCGVQNNNNASSLWSSIVSDTSFASNSGVMNVPAVAAANTMTFDSVAGILFYNFGAYKLHPRNNDDFMGSSVALEATNYPDIPDQIISIAYALNKVDIYPNPSSDFIRIKSSEYDLNRSIVQITDLQGRKVLVTELNSGINEISLGDLKQGIYMVRTSTRNGTLISLNKLVKN